MTKCRDTELQATNNNSAAGLPKEHTPSCSVYLGLRAVQTWIHMVIRHSEFLAPRISLSITGRKIPPLPGFIQVSDSDICMPESQGRVADLRL